MVDISTFLQHRFHFYVFTQETFVVILNLGHQEHVEIGATGY